MLLVICRYKSVFFSAEITVGMVGGEICSYLRAIYETNKSVVAVAFQQ